MTNSSCNVCCCESDSIMPGETAARTINYADFSLPIGGRGITANTTFSIEQQTTSNTAPVLYVTGPTLLQTNSGTSISGTVVPQSVIPVGSVAFYKHLPIYGPSSGTVNMSVDGTFVYTPTAGHSGYDRIYYELSDGVNPPRIGEIIIAVNPALPALPLPAPVAALATPVLRVIPNSTSVNTPAQSLSFALQASPAAKVGDIYRLTINQPASNCDGIIYNNIKCYDVTISKC